MEKLKENSRIRYIDYFKAISMVFVVMAHTDFANQGVKTWINSFVMPGFFLASGVFLKDDRDLSWADGARFVWKRMQSLMIPYLLYALIYAKLSPINVVKILYASHSTLHSSGSLTSLWFLPALMVALAMYAAARCLLKQRFRLTAKLILTALAFIVASLLPQIKHGYPWCANVSVTGFAFLLLGNLSFPLMQRFRRAVSRGGAGLALGLVVLVASFAATLLYHVNDPYTPYVMMATGRYGNYIFFLIWAFVGIIFTTTLCILIERLLPPMRRDMLCYIGQHTMVIFATQKPIIAGFKILFSLVSAPAVVQLAVTCVGTMIGCCLLAMLVDRFIPILNGHIAQKV